MTGANEQRTRDADANRAGPIPYRRGHPLDFSVYDTKNGHYVLYISDNPKEEHSLTLELQNISSQTLVFPANLGTQASKDKHHLELVFRANTLSRQTIDLLKAAAQNKNDPAKQVLDPASNWTLAVEDVPGQPTSIFLLYTGAALTLQPGQRLPIVLKRISAAPGTGARGTQAELVPCGVTFQGDTWPITGTRVQHLYITDHEGNRTMPVHVGFVGSNRVLNDGSSTTELTLHIVNVGRPARLEDPDSSITLKQTASKIRITSDFFSNTDTNRPDQPWALCEESEFSLTADVAVVTKAGGRKPRTIDRRTETHDEGSGQALKATVLTWIPQGDHKLQRGDYVEIKLPIKSSSKRIGVAKLYVSYEGIPGYWDGHWVLPVEKSPLLFTDNAAGVDTVGIGTSSPAARLELAILDTDAKTDLLAVRKGSNSSYLRITNGGNVVVGPAPVFSDARLTVSKTADDYLYVWFNQTEKEKGTPGRLELVGWRDGWNINARTPNKNLYLNRDADATSNVLIGCYTKELFVRGSDGSVGIGTSTPGAKLELAISDTDPTDLLAVKKGTTSSYLRITNGGNVVVGPAPVFSDARLTVSKTADDYLYVWFNQTEEEKGTPGRLEVVGWRDGWNINARTASKNLYLNRDADATSNVLIGRYTKELFVRGSDGSVGIGTNAPADGAKLDVRGAIKLDDGTLWASGARENLRLVRGTVSSNGTILKGAGFSARRLGAGLYEIVFSPAFPDDPSASVTQLYPNDTRSSGGKTTDNAVLVGINGDLLRIKTGDGSGEAQDRAFSFVVMGPRTV